jgi:Fe-S cluster biogenesis protein NfuA
MDEATITAAVEELRALVRGDGADLELVEFDPANSRVALRLDLSEVTCEECVLPPDVLGPLVADSFSRRVPGPVEVVLDDPRRATAT